LKINENDAQLYYELMWSLQLFVNQKKKIHTGIKSLEDYEQCRTEEKRDVRRTLYAEISLIDVFVQENPQKLSEDKLSIVSGWKHLVQGDFFIERYLKKHAVFIKGMDVYGVLGIFDSFDELIHRSHLPLKVNAVLLPFKGRIIHDGLLNIYNIDYGSGIKKELKEIYMTAKQNGSIIEDLLSPSEKSGKDQKKSFQADEALLAALDLMAEKANKMKGSQDGPAIQSPAFSLVRASLELAKASVSDPDDLDNISNILKKVGRAYKKSVTVYNRQDHWM